MVDRESVCKACEGTGMLADDEGWQYMCSVCHGEGTVHKTASRQAKLMSVDNNNRLLD
ncbi:hypothetical protein [Virgibacillus alimentarius]|uniref:DnaJ-class molecular chaperone n=1 Tax=Virgibacillus alimentarius TaxID=698769 RepID=A0ABS4S6U0_9BACI|nr:MULTISPECIES: hypothetical protein [Virgibacillus]MBP2257192.1 DnaJ-class molecular chaperone [Virgibacillus alimentarius]HLR67423.1 hypothetical protein [Virgibacillus sp.]